MRSKNPFKPSFGRVPLYMAGRDDILDEICLALESDWEAPCLTSLFVGARGTGKTALLTQVANEGAALGWISVNVPAGKGMLEDIYERFLEGTEHLVKKPGDTHISGVSVGQLFAIDWVRDARDKGNWRTRMNKLLSQLEELEIGLLITIDEVGADIPELVEFVSIYQQFIRENRRVALFMAGLPSRVNTLLTDKQVSFLRRAERYDIARIADYDVKEAFARTIEMGGKDVDEEALHVMTDAAGGYAYMVQLIGHRTWIEARDAQTITKEQAMRGIRAARHAMTSKIYDVTARELSAGDLRFLVALARVGDGSTLATVARDMGVSTSYASNYRRRLEKQGIISETFTNKLRFDLPGFDAYLLEQA